MRVETLRGDVIDAETEAFVAALIEQLPAEQFNRMLRRVEELQGAHEMRTGRIVLAH